MPVKKVENANIGAVPLLSQPSKHQRRKSSMDAQDGRLMNLAGAPSGEDQKFGFQKKTSEPEGVQGSKDKESVTFEEFANRHPVRALQDLRHEAFKFFSGRRIPRIVKNVPKIGRLKNNATRRTEVDFCELLSIRIDSYEEKLRIIEVKAEKRYEELKEVLVEARNRDSDNGELEIETKNYEKENREILGKVRRGLISFRWWMESLRVFGSPGRARSEVHPESCSDRNCLGYCTLWETNSKGEFRVLPEDFGVARRKNGSSHTYTWVDGPALSWKGERMKLSGGLEQDGE